MAKYLSNRVRTFDIGITSITESDVVLNVIGNTTFTGDVSLGDNNVLSFGDGDDLRILHLGNQNWIQNNAGDFNIQQNDDDSDITFRSDDGSGGITEYINIDGSTGEVVLYHYGSQKFATKSTGIDVTGLTETDTLNVSGVSTFQSHVELGDNDELRFGDGQDLEILHDGTNSVINHRAEATGSLFVISKNKLTLQTQDSGGTIKNALIARVDGATELYHNNSKKFETTSTGIDVTGNTIKLLGPTSGSTFTTSTLTLRGYRQSAAGEFANVDFNNIDANSSNTEYLATRISGQLGGNADGGELKFFVTPNNSTTLNTTPSLILHNDSSAEFTGVLDVDIVTDLGTSAGDSQDIAKFRIDSANNSILKIVEKRDVNGTDWTSAYTRIQKMVDTTQMGYIQFNGDGLNYGMEFGTVGNEKFAQFIRNGAVELYHDNSKKFETTSTGATVTGTLLATSLSTGASGTGINISTNTITGPSTLTIDPAAIGDNTGTVVIAGNLQIDGTTTTVNSTTMTVDDKNLELGTGAANDAAADGGGITIVSGDGNKTFQFEATGDNLGSSENLNLANTKEYKINNTSVLSATTLGSGVTASSLTSVGTLNGLTVDGDLSISDKITHLGDTNTTIRFPANDTIRFATSGSNRLDVSPNGYILVGTTSEPSGGDAHAQNAKLLVQGRIGNAADSGRLNLQRGSSASNDSSIGSLSFTDNSNNAFSRIETFADATPGSNDYPGRIVFSTTNDGASTPTEKLRITSGGLVGIGTDNPDTLLHLQSSTPILKFTDDNQATDNKSWNIAANASQLLRIQAVNDSGNGGGQLFDFYRSGTQIQKFLGRSGTDYWFEINNNTKKVGIGIENPATTLEVAGTGSPTIRVTDLDGTDQFGQIIANNGTIVVESRNDTSTGRIMFRGRDGSGTVEYGRFDSNGDLGIGIDNPQERLHVSSVILATGETPQIRLNSSAADASDNDRSMLGQATAANNFVSTSATGDTVLRGTSTGNLLFGIGTSEKLRIGSSGQIGLGGANYGTSGQVLTSNGSSSAPTWQNATASVSAGDESGDTTCFPLFAIDASGPVTLKTDASGLTYNSADEILSATTFSGSTLVSTVSTGTAPLTVTSTTLVSNLNADLLDGQQGSFYLNTGTTFGGDVSGTYNNIAITNDSHTHQFNNLTSKDLGTGFYSTSGNLESGRGSGGVALTINDGYGNANVTFNHRSGTPEQNGKAGRIVVNTDATTGDATMNFQLGDATANTQAGINQILSLSSGTSVFDGTSGLTFNNRPAFNGGTSGSTAPFTVDSTFVVTNLNADLLDGEGGTFYTNASNIDAGTLAIARGGTNGSATPTAGGAAYGTGTAYAFTAAGTSGQVLTSNGASAPTWQDVSLSADDESTDTTCFPLFATADSGPITLKTDASGLTYDSDNERLQSTDVAVKGAVRVENSGSTERFEILYNETTDSLDFTYSAS